MTQQGPWDRNPEQPQSQPGGPSGPQPGAGQPEQGSSAPRYGTGHPGQGWAGTPQGAGPGQGWAAAQTGGQPPQGWTGQQPPQGWAGQQPPQQGGSGPWQGAGQQPGSAAQTGGQPPQGWTGQQPPQQGWTGQQPPQQWPGQQPQQPTGQQPWTGRQPAQGGATPGGGKPPTGGKASPRSLIVIAVVSVLVLGLLGWGAATLFANGDDPTPVPPAPVPTRATPSPPSPTSTPTTAPTSPTATTPPATTGQAISIGNGISFELIQGWQIYQQKDSLVSITNGKAVILLQTFVAKPGMTGTSIVDAYHAQLAETMTDVTATPATVTTLDSRLDVGQGQVIGTKATSQGSLRQGAGSLASVRQADGVTVISTLLWDASGSVSALNDPWQAVTVSALESQLG